ncbi:hypothetical protein [Glycomyces halotolerans]
MTNPPQAQEKKPRPGSVTVAVVLQLALAAVLIVSGVLGLLYGAEAQEAFENELAAQGVGGNEMAAGAGGFDSAANLIFPGILAVLLIVLGLLNAAGNRPGRILTWIFQPLILICGGFIFAGSVFAAQLMQWTFDNSGDEQLESLDAQALVDAAYSAYPAWSVIVDWAVILLATVGSLLVIILLAVPASNAYFRKEPPQQYIPGAPPQ